MANDVTYTRGVAIHLRVQGMRFNNIILGSLTSVFRYGGPAGWKCDTRAEIPTDVAVCAMKYRCLSLQEEQIHDTIL